MIYLFRDVAWMAVTLISRTIFNRKDASPRKKYILAIFLPQLPRLPTYIYEPSNFHGASRFQYPGQADSETYGNVHRCFYTGMDR